MRRCARTVILKKPRNDMETADDDHDDRSRNRQRTQFLGPFLYRCGSGNDVAGLALGGDAGGGFCGAPRCCDEIGLAAAWIRNNRRLCSNRCFRGGDPLRSRGCCTRAVGAGTRLQRVIGRQAWIDRHPCAGKALRWGHGRRRSPLWRQLRLANFRGKQGLVGLFQCRRRPALCRYLHGLGQFRGHRCRFGRGLRGGLVRFGTTHVALDHGKTIDDMLDGAVHCFERVFEFGLCASIG